MIQRSVSEYALSQVVSDVEDFLQLFLLEHIDGKNMVSSEPMVYRRKSRRYVRWVIQISVTVTLETSRIGERQRWWDSLWGYIIRSKVDRWLGRRLDEMSVGIYGGYQLIRYIHNKKSAKYELTHQWAHRRYRRSYRTGTSWAKANYPAPSWVCWWSRD